MAQKAHVSGQPDWLERHSERRPSRNRISTASTGRPSGVANSAFSVPSRELASRSTERLENGTLAASRSRSAAGRSDIGS